MRELLAIMERLRGADGCPWDRMQTFASIAPYTIEESYEVADAIERGDVAHLKDELGDLLFQVIFHAQIAREAGLFDFDAVAGAICDKLVRRHPHVFGERILNAGQTPHSDGNAANAGGQTPHSDGNAANAGGQTPHPDGNAANAGGQSPYPGTAKVGGQRPHADGLASSAGGGRRLDVPTSPRQLTAAQQSVAWEDIKARERATGSSALDGVPLALPALMRAFKLSKRAARVGFDFAETAGTADKVAEELAEVREAVAANPASAAASPEMFEEVGDLLFAAANLARKLEVDAEAALRAANNKFARRFQGMERLAAQRGQTFETLSLAEQEALWQEVKRAE
ncbi:MAG: nucleoside triphosphate pyrophosphohydrolase [Pseudomonadota bacterium]|nr:nucleoside triphosphate pyrophosphohydrolase [Pseudomonadota bacterium]